MIPRNIHAFWFSPLYHTRQLALRLSHSLAAEAGDLPVHGHDITNDARAIALLPEDLAILAIPVYAGHVPPLAAERLKHVSGENTPAIILASYGNRAYDDALAELREIARACGLLPFAAAACIARHTIGLIYAQGRPDAKDLAELGTFAKNVVKKLANPLTPVTVPGNLPDKTVPVFPLPQTVNENCVFCGHCWEQCPPQAITHGKPAEIDASLCICCMRCVAICPENARIPEPKFIEGIRNKLAPLCAQPKPNEFFGV